jgi:hypothetical protein
MDDSTVKETNDAALDISWDSGVALRACCLFDVHHFVRQVP